jgi:hypothetical protein
VEQGAQAIVKYATTTEGVTGNFSNKKEKFPGN